MNYLPILFVTLSLTVLPHWAQAAMTGDASSGAEVAVMCASCHQPDGAGKNNDSSPPWPRLAGLNAGYIAKQLRDFQSGARKNVAMSPFATMLSAQQILDVSQYYSEIPPSLITVDAPPDEQRLKRGQMLAQRGDWSKYIVSCKSCHGPDNQGAGSGFPGIAGQQVRYIEGQLKAWKAGIRNNDPQDLMGTIARRLNDEDIRAVAAWLASQPAGSGAEETQP